MAVDRTSKYAFAGLMKTATTASAKAFLNELVEAVPYKIHTVLTDNGIQFADLRKNRTGPTPCGAAIPSIEPAGGTASSIVSPSPTIPGPTVRSKG